jgi:hypothetical protein
MAPEMLSLLIVIDGRDRLIGKKRDPVSAVEAAFNDQVSAADIGHGPFVMTGRFDLGCSHGNLRIHYIPKKIVDGNWQAKEFSFSAKCWLKASAPLETEDIKARSIAKCFAIDNTIRFD